jgi:hypothetical protein
MPVCNPVMMSVAASGTGLKPLAFHVATMLSSPAHVNILVFFRPSTFETGFFVKKNTQPPCPQDSSTKPFASSRWRSTGSSFSSTAYSSGYDVKNMGTLKMLNAGRSTRARRW